MITVAFDSTKNVSSRKAKRIAFEQADQIYIEIHRGHNSIVFAGQYPVTQLRSGQTVMELQHVVEGQIGAPGVARASIQSTIKHLWKRRASFSVVARHIDDFASWQFLRHWIETVNDYGVYILCLVPDSLPANQRYVTCSVVVSANSRILAEKWKKKIAMVLEPSTAIQPSLVVST